MSMNHQTALLFEYLGLNEFYNKSSVQKYMSMLQF